MKNKTTKKIQEFALIITTLIIVSSCSMSKPQWSDCTVELGLDHYVPHYLSEVKYFSESENGELTVVKDCYIVESFESPICYSTGNNSRFEMRHYRVNQGIGISYSIVYYFDGKEKRIIDSSGDNVFSDFALCDGKRLCYLVSDGTLRVLENDGGRKDYEYFFDSEIINLDSHQKRLSLSAVENKITLLEERFYPYGGVAVNDEDKPETYFTEINSLEIDETSKCFNKSNNKINWSDKTCPTFAADGINNIPHYINQYKKVRAYSKAHTYNGEVYYREVNIIAEGGYIVLDDVLCYSTGANEGYAVKSYRYECDENPLFFEIYRFENGKLKLLNFSGDNSFENKFLCNGEQLCCIVDKDCLRVFGKDGSRFDIALNSTFQEIFKNS